ncbi:hypothetical protein GJ496_000419 [Pomphorhynchus laevis]|nr:hypothetical protein GJ496_000419 [Pomphorhynchus laevis]
MIFDHVCAVLGSDQVMKELSKHVIIPVNELLLRYISTFEAEFFTVYYDAFWKDVYYGGRRIPDICNHGNIIKQPWTRYNQSC